MSNIVFFDFDGTITSSDSLSDFLRFNSGRSRYLLIKYALFFPYYVALFLNLITYEKLKKKWIKTILKNKSYKDIYIASEKFYNLVLTKQIKEEALKTLKKHRENGDKIVIVSASLDIILTFFCKQHNCDLIANKLNFSKSVCSGKIEGIDCNGEEKVKRIKRKYNLKSFKNIYAYGDTKLDYPMLQIADYKFYKSFK